MNPNTGSGKHQVFTFVTSDPQGASHLYRTHIQFRSNINPSVVCYVAILPPNNIDLMNDALKGWLPPVPAGTSETIGNGYCSVNAAGSSIQDEGNNRTVKLDMTFKAAMAGASTITLTADNRQETMSAALTGTWAVQ